MTRQPIPDDVRRFILTSIVSVPYLEAMLLLRKESEEPWDATRLAGRLYMGEKSAAEVLEQLFTAGLVRVVEPQLRSYCYHPASEDLRQMVSRLADVYARNLVDVTNLIHSTVTRTAQQFADAFRLRKDA